MTFDEILAQIMALLEREGRVSYRALKRRFTLDDEFVEDLKAEIIDAKRLAIDENGTVLVWTGGSARSETPAAGKRDTSQLTESQNTEAPSSDSNLLNMPQSRTQYLASYTPRHLTEKILSHRNALEGERKQVTVLFCDIVDSSRLTQKLDVEVLHQLMDEVLRLMASAVHRYEGTVNQYLGDGLMALFGAPIALEDHALRAIQAALTIHETISGYNAQLQRDYNVEVGLRLGLNTGLVVVGRIGDDLRMDYTALGNTTYLAARMQEVAEPGAILCTEATHRLVAGYIHSTALGLMTLRGQNEPIAAYQVTGRRQGRSRLDVRAEHGLTRLVGRQRELALMQDCLARAESGHGQVVGIMGEAGAGKSRLLHEFQTSGVAERVSWLTGQCLAYGQATPYLPFIDMLRTMCQIEEADNTLQIREKLRQAISWLDAGLMGTLPYLEALFDVPGGEEALRHLTFKDRRQQTFQAIQALIMAGSQMRPLVLVFENLHWIDRTSEECLALVLEGLAGIRVLVLTTHRPGHTIPCADKTYYTQLALDLLTEAETTSMVDTLLNSHNLPTGLVGLIQEKAGGNPLFIEEVVHALIDRGLLIRQNGEVHWTGETMADFPATMQDIMQARIDRLAGPVKHTAQMAAVIGRDFDVSLLSRVVHDTADIEQNIEVLKQTELIHQVRFFPEVEYRFKHAVIQEAAYQSLLVRQRRALHGFIGQLLEEMYDERREEQAVILAHHFARSPYQDKAVMYALLAGERAARLYANTEATSYYEQALAMARALPDSPHTRRVQIDAGLKLAAMGTTRQDMERDQGNLEQGRQLAEALGDEPRLAQILYWLGRHAYTRGDMTMAGAYAEESLAIADRLGEEALAAPPVNLVGRVHWILADYEKASQLLARSAEQMRRIGNATEEATAAGFAGWTFGFLGQLAQGLAYAERGLHLAQESRNPFAEAAAYLYRGAVYDQYGEWERALSDYDESIRIAEQVGDVFRIYVVKGMQGRAYVMAGDLHRGRMTIEEGLAMSTQLGTQFQRAWPTTYLASCLLILGDADRAQELCDEAIQLAEAAGDQYGQFMAYRTLAEVLGQHGADAQEESERAMTKSIEIQKRLGTQPELARTYVCYARLLREQGQIDQAATYLTQAILLFQEMSMTWDLAQAEQALRALP